ncbi:uncharacterized protein [Leptinotarsa decemlineata]|uniref:uncharacterized protein n=1 Tax=Leptinotarsa decemlineata TaxID=7539 RepID=UPI000C251AE9|nr:zinc finger CW-type PWWP domain protein 1-like [Leptinotarsa decemlineata]
MPLLSKKTFAKPTKRPAKAFKQPVLTHKNIEKILGEDTEKPRRHSSNASSKASFKDNNVELGSNSSKKCLSESLSFEESQPEYKSEDLSYRMNEPAVKDAYLKFVKSFSQSNKGDSICSTPATKADSILSKSLEDLFKSLPADEAEASGTSKQKILDSSESLSQEVLNRKEVKDAYLKCMDQFMGEEKFDFMKNFKPAKKRAKSFKNSPEKIKIPKQTSNSSKISKDKNITNSKKVNNEAGKKRKLPEDGALAKTDRNKEKTGRNSKEKKTKQENISLYDKMILIQESRNVGLYAICDICDKARYLPDVTDPLDLPDKWYCSMNPDEKHNNCNSPEEVYEEEEYLVEKLYNAGSIVWAKIGSYPWWPAMVEDDPDFETYFWLEKDILLPTWYHVTFFDTTEVTRAWLRPSCIKPFKINMNNSEFQTPKFDKHKSRIEESFKQAVEATELPLIERLRKYSFIQRYPKLSSSTKTVVNKKQSQSRRMTKKNENGSIKKKPKTVRRMLSSKENSLVECDNISDILDTMDLQNEENLNMNKKQSQLRRMTKKNENGLLKKKPKTVRRILSSKENSLVECDNISDILDTMDLQNEENLNINLLQRSISNYSLTY